MILNGDRSQSVQLTRRQWLAFSAGAVLAARLAPLRAQPAAPPEPTAPELVQLGKLEGHHHAVNGVAISPDGKRAATASFDCTVRLWDLASRECLRVLGGHESPVRHVAFSPDGQWLLSGSWDKTARLWEVQTGKEIRALRGHEWPVLDVAISPDGHQALTCSDGFRLWNLDTGELIRHFTGHSKTVWSVAFSPDGKRALTGSWDETMRLWELDSGKQLLRCGGHDDRVMSVHFSPDGNSGISCCTGDNAVRLWNLDSGEEIRRFNTREPGIVSLAFTSDGTRVLAGEGTTNDSGGLDVTYPQAAVYIWEITSGRLLAKSPVMKGYVSDIAVAPDGRTAISSGYEFAPRIWKLPA